MLNWGLPRPAPRFCPCTINISYRSCFRILLPSILLQAEKIDINEPGDNTGRVPVWFGSKLQTPTVSSAIANPDESPPISGHYNCRSAVSSAALILALLHTVVPVIFAARSTSLVCFFFARQKLVVVEVCCARKNTFAPRSRYYRRPPPIIDRPNDAEQEKHQKVAKNKQGSSRPEGALAVGGGTRTAGKSKRGSTPQESDRPGSVGDGDTASTSLDWPIRCSPFCS